MNPWIALWTDAFHERFRFWNGFSAGGILAVPHEIPQREVTRRTPLQFLNSFMTPFGMSLGNESGEQLADCVLRAEPERPPRIAIMWGLTERVPEPRVKVTAEHADCVRDQILLLVVPKKGRKSLKFVEELPDWFRAFGMTIDHSLMEPSSELRAEMTDWFSDPNRKMFAMPISGGESNAAWQLAVIYYIAEHWAVSERGIDSIHFVANIEGKPCFRKNWTSNK